MEDITNSRPLTYVSSEETVMLITPNHFLRLRQFAVIDELEVDLAKLPAEKLPMLECYTAALHAIETYRATFFRFYLQSLREAHVNTHRHPKGSVSFIPQPGAVVIIQDDKAPRSKWQLGEIKRVDRHGGVTEVLVKSGIPALNKPFQQTVQSRIIQRVIS